MYFKELAEIGANVATIVTVLAVAIGFIQYINGQKIKRAEFYTDLFKMLFKDTTYLRIRERLDEDEMTEDYFLELEDDLKSDKDGIQAEMTNYFNFLEYIMVLEKERIIKGFHVSNLLKYYLKQLSRNRVAMNYIRNYSFSNLLAKINKVQ